METMMEYKGYRANIEFNAEDRLLVGKVFGLSDSISFHGRTIDEVEEMFHQSVDNYLDVCAQIGKSPEREFKGTFNVRITPELHQAIHMSAFSRHLTLNQFVAEALKAAIINCEKEPSAFEPARRSDAAQGSTRRKSSAKQR